MDTERYWTEIILERLRNAWRGVMEAEDFRFMDWSTCACGQLFRAASGYAGVPSAVAGAHWSEYRALLALVLEANPPPEDADPDEEAYYRTLGIAHQMSHRASDYAWRIAEKRLPGGPLMGEADYRAGALELIERTIRFVEDRGHGDE